MKTKSFFITALLIATTIVAKSQCSVVIAPADSITICNGDSVILSITASFPVTSQVIDQQQSNYNGGMSALTGPGRSEFQTFVAGITGTLTQIDMGFFNYMNGVGILTLREGGDTTGTILNSQTVTVYCPSGNCTLSFPENHAVVAGTLYNFQFTPGAGMPYPYGVQVENPGTYSGGELFITDPSGVYATGMDMVFATYVGVSDSLQYLWSDGSADSTLVVNSTGNYSVTVTGSSCSAIDSVEITVTPDAISTTETIVCPNQLPYNWNGNFYAATGTYSATFTSASGCDSIATLHLTVVSFDSTASISGNTITASQNNAAYQWLDCNNSFAAISGATEQSYSATVNGSYAVAVTLNGCTTTSDCLDITGVGIGEFQIADFKLQISPNPSDGNISINIFSADKTLHFKIEDVTGRILFEKNIASGNSKMDLSFLPSGIYFSVFENKYSQIIRKIIIE